MSDIACSKCTSVAALVEDAALGSRLPDGWKKGYWDGGSVYACPACAPAVDAALGIDQAQ